MGVAWVGKQTRLRKIILSSGTLCPLRTSTAFAADPPVAISNVSIGSQCRSKRVQTEHRVQEENVSRGNVLGQLRIAPFPQCCVSFTNGWGFRTLAKYNFGSAVSSSRWINIFPSRTLRHTSLRPASMA